MSLVVKIYRVNNGLYSTALVLTSVFVDFHYCMLCFSYILSVLKRYDKGTTNGLQLVDKLRANRKMTRTERIFFVKVLGKYVMKKALRLVLPGS